MSLSAIYIDKIELRWTLLANFDNIKIIFLKADYPVSFVDNIIGSFKFSMDARLFISINTTINNYHTSINL